MSSDSTANVEKRCNPHKDVISPISTPQDDVRAAPSSQCSDGSQGVVDGGRRTAACGHRAAESARISAYAYLLEQEVATLKTQLETLRQRQQSGESKALRHAEAQEQIVKLKSQLKHMAAEHDVRLKEKDVAMEGLKQENERVSLRLLELQVERDALAQMLRQREKSQSAETEVKDLKDYLAINEENLRAKDSEVAALRDQLQARYNLQSSHGMEKCKRLQAEGQLLYLDVEHKQALLENTRLQQKLRDAQQQIGKMKRKINQLRTSNLHVSDLSNDAGLRRKYAELQRAESIARQMNCVLQKENEQARQKLGRVSAAYMRMEELCLSHPEVDFKYKTKDSCYRLGMRACADILKEVLA